MAEDYETMNVEFPGLPEEMKVPIGAVYRGKEILRRFYEPNFPESDVPMTETPGWSKWGTFRLPEFCYGFKAPIDDKPTIIGTHERLNHVLDLMADYGISRALGRELVKLIVAQTFAEAYKPAAKKGDKEAAEMIVSIDNAVERAWDGTLF